MASADPTGAISAGDAGRVVGARAPGDLRARLLALEGPRAFDFDDPREEWRRLFSEILGTFLLVLAGAGGGVVGAVSHGAISRTAAVTAPGLTVMAVILFMGAVGGAHLNPAVSVMFSLRGDFPWRRVPGYIVAQLLGATLARLFLSEVFGKVAVACAYVLRGANGDPGGRAAARGRLGPDAEA